MYDHRGSSVLARLSKKIAARRKRKTHVVRFGERTIETRGLAEGFWTDLYHRALTVYWPVFFATAAAIFVLLNTVFAFLYWLGRAPIANVSPDLPLSLFYFSIETLATVGYGDMHPQTNYGHLIATIEIFTGMSFLAVMTGLIFARFSRPRARFIFTRHPVVTTHQGKPTLMFRVANARNNTISQTTARLWLFRMEKTIEGRPMRRYHELALERSEHPMFALSWSLFHFIDEDSPLYRITADDLAAVEGDLVLNVGGVDDSSAQRLNARYVYSHRDIRWNHHYVDITGTSDDGWLLIDYEVFHDVVPDTASS
jgi:inward rectifier potassium channel